jgi:hypothetical protein
MAFRSWRIITTILLPMAVIASVAAIIMPLVTFTVFVFAESIQGTSGDDTLKGTVEPDTINGLEGNDLILGEPADDILDGGKGDDEIRGGDGVMGPLEMKPITETRYMAVLEMIT